jgi:hypothetical protein
MVNVLLNDGQAKRKVSKLVGSWAVADNQVNAKTKGTADTRDVKLPPREFSPPYATTRQSPRQLILETDLALLQGRSLGVLGMTNHSKP